MGDGGVDPVCVEHPPLLLDLLDVVRDLVQDLHRHGLVSYDKDTGSLEND